MIKHFFLVLLSWLGISEDSFLDFIQSTGLYEPKEEIIEVKEVKNKWYVAQPPYEVIVSYMQGNGIGYQGGYSTMAVFLASEMWLNNYIFLDGRVHVLNNGNFDYNLGIGVRRISSNGKGFLGLNSFFDYRDTDGPWKRISLGIESGLGPFLFSLNGYLIVGGNSSPIKIEKYAYDDGYICCNVYETQMFKYSWDGEMGCFLLRQPEFQAYVAGGPYYLKNTTPLAFQENIWGGKGRVFIEIKKTCRLEFIYSKDSFFGRKCQGQITFIIPFCKRDRKGSYRPVNRQEIIPLTDIEYYTWNW